MDAAEIQKLILKYVEAWRPSVWGWPHDSFMHEPWGYAIHQASVGAWNDEGRKTECVQFLREWATLDNIAAALEKCPLTVFPPNLEGTDIVIECDAPWQNW